MQNRLFIILTLGIALTGCANMPNTRTSTVNQNAIPESTTQTVNSASNSGTSSTITTPRGTPNTSAISQAQTSNTSPDSENQNASFNQADIDKNTRNLLNLIRANLDLPNLNTPLVAQDEEWYRQRPAYVKRMLKRSKRYLYYIVTQVKKRDMPMEIALLPMVESAFNPQALSRSKASGIWQFIPDTGRDFGLDQNHWMDERRDIKAATNAALTYLDRLHGDLGNWYLALAAYNCGEGLVNQLIARQKALGLPTNYLSLPLPEQTKNYVPQLLAVRDIIEHPASYGLETDFIPNKAYFKDAPLKEPLDVHEAAILADIPLKEFKALNPAYKHSFIPSSTGSILLPVDKVSVFEQHLTQFNNPLRNWRRYIIRRGEWLHQIAQKTGTSVRLLAEVNGLPDNSHFRFYRQQELLAPPFHEYKYSGGHDIYTVRVGDTLYKIAHTHHINLRQLVALNGGRTVLKPGEILHLVPKNFQTGIYPAHEAQVQLAETNKHDLTHFINSHNHGKNIYTVRPGDTLYGIAHTHHINTEQLLALNGGKTTLRPGQTLHLVPENTQEARQDNVKQHIRLTRYTVRRGDTLDSIAHRFNVNINDIERWNRIPQRKILHPGDHVKLYGG